MKLWRIIPFVLVALFVLAAPLQAQDEPATFCGDLPEADCQLLLESQAAMQALESTTFTLEADVNVENVPDMPFEALTFHLTGNGSFAADTTAFADLQPQDFLGDPAQLFPLVADVLREVAADMTFTLDIPGELNSFLHEDEPRLPESVSLTFRMVEGVLYLNMDDVLDAAPGATVPPGWVGLDVAELYGSILPEMMEDTVIAPSFDMVPMVNALMQPENMAKFMVIERLPDAEIDGQAVAVFQTRLDYAAMLDIPEFREMLEAILEEQGEEADIEEIMAAIRAMYEGMTLVITESVGLEDRLVHSTEVEMVWDLSGFEEMIGEEAAPLVSLNLVVTQEQFNNAPEVVAPEDATLLPLQQMFAGAERER